MESKDLIALMGIISTLLISLATLLINYRRELRAEILKKEEQAREHQLKLKEKEFEFRYSKLHEKRLEAMAQLYSQLESFRGDVDMVMLLFDEGTNDTEWIKKMLKEQNDSLAFFNKNKLYFSKELASQIQNFTFLLSDLDSFAYSYLKDPHDVPQLEAKRKELGTNRRDIEDTLGKIENEFRTLIGSSNSMEVT